MRSEFSREKALELILYAATRIQDPTLHTISKVLYFADKEHLSEFGRLMAGDRYVAMKHGPVPSGTYDILKFVRDGGHPFFSSMPEASDSLTVEGHRVTPLRDSDPAMVSESERDCLEEAISRYGNLSFQELTRLSHDAPWHEADENDSISIESLAESQPDATSLLEYLRDPYPED